MSLPPSGLRVLGAALGVLLLAGTGRASEAIVQLEPQSGAAKFAADEIKAAVRHHGSAPKGLRIVLREDNTSLKPEAFRLMTSTEEMAQVFTVTGGGPGGVMYGGLELAEQIRLYGWDKVVAIKREPHFAMRGVKFNLPLDVRTPSYTDMSDSGQANIATVWDFEFWREYLDQLARDRYNYVSL